MSNRYEPPHHLTNRHDFKIGETLYKHDLTRNKLHKVTVTKVKKLVPTTETANGISKGKPTLEAVTLTGEQNSGDPLHYSIVNEDTVQGTDLYQLFATEEDGKRAITYRKKWVTEGLKKEFEYHKRHYYELKEILKAND